MSISTANGVAFDKRPNVSIDQELAYRVLAPQSAEYLHQTDTLHAMRKGYQSFKNYSLGFVDVQPVQTTPTWGQEVEIRYGNEGYGLLVAAELIYAMPELRDSAASNKNPADATYAGAATFLNWKPYVGELLCGNPNERFEQGIATTPLRHYRALGIHCKRAVSMNTYNGERAAYNERVGANPTTHTGGEIIIHDVHLPWAKDMYDRNHGMPMHAFGSEFYMRWKLPSLRELVQTDLAHANIASSAVGPTIRLRLHYVYTERAERAFQASNVISQTGHSYLSHHIAHETAKTSIADVATTQVNEVSIEIKNNQQPCSFIMFVVRAEEDLLQVGEAGTNDTNSPPRTVGAVVRRPDPFRFLPWNKCWLNDTSGNRLTSEITRGYWRLSSCHGFTRYFPNADRIQNIGIIPFGHFPSQEGLTSGQMPFKVMNQPTLVVELPALVDQTAADGGVGEPAGVTRRIDVMYIEPNTTTAKNGHMYKKWAVSS